MTPNELAEAAATYNITEHLDHPNLLHGPVAAEKCRRELGIDDEDVLDAIRWHTTGRADWSRVGQALYIADFNEPLRTHDGAEQARALLIGEGFSAALRFVIRNKLENVKKRYTLDENSQAFADWVERELSR